MAGFDIESFFKYFLIFLPIVYCPGPMTMLCMSHGMSVGPVRSLPSFLGGTSAYIIQMLVVLFGMSLLQGNPLILTTIRYTGAAYLGYMGWNYLFRKKSLLGGTVRDQNLSKKGLFLSGFLVAISNPKAALVFTSIFPRFIDLQSSYTSQYMKVCVIFLVLQFTSAFSYALMGETFFRWVTKANKEAFCCKVIGITLAAIAVTLASPV